MKNILIIILVCLIIIAGALFIARITSQPDLKKLLPVSTAVYLYTSDLPLLKSGLKETIIFKETKGLKIGELWQNRVRDFYGKMEDHIGFDFRQLEPYFKKDAAFAVLEFSKDKKDVLFAFLANIKDTKKDLSKYIEEQLKPQLKSRGYKIASKNFRGSEYYVVAHNEPLCYYTFFGKAFIVTPKEEVLLQIINLQKNKGKTLKDNEGFRNATGKLSYEDGLLAYVDITKILAPFEEKWRSEKKEKSIVNLFNLMGIGSLDRFALTSSIEKGGFRSRSYVQMKRDVPGLMQIVLKQKPRKVNSPKYIPRDFPVVIIGAYNNPSQIWEDFLGQLSELSPADKFKRLRDQISAAEKLLNLDLKRDIFDCLGNEMAFCAQMNKSESTSEIKGPLEILEKGSFLLFIEVKKAKKFSEFLERMMAAGNLYLQTKQQEEEYKGYQIKYIQGDKVSPANPGYTFIDEFCLVSPYIEDIKKAINSYQTGKVLDSYPDYLRCYDDMENRVNRVMYIDIANLLERTPQLTLNMVLPKELSEQQRKVYQRELKQLSKVLFGSCMVAWVTKDGVMVDSFSSVGFIPLLTGKSFVAPFMKKIPSLTQ
jgi:hypothetical protein